MFTVGPAHPISPDFDPDLTGTSTATSAISGWRYGTVAEFAMDWSLCRKFTRYRLDMLCARGDARVFDADSSGCHEWIVLTTNR